MCVALYPNFNPGGIADAVCNYPTTTSGLENGVMKIPIYTMDWMEIAGVALSAEAKAARQTLKDAKNIVIGVPELLSAANNFKNHSYAVVYGRDRVGAAVDAGFDIVDSINPVSDIVQFGVDKGLIEIEAETATALNLAGNVALVLGTGRQAIFAAGDIIHENNELARSSLPREQVIHQAKSIKGWLDLAKYVSYVALGVINLVGFFLSIPIQPWIGLACLTSALVFTLGSYFHGQLSVLRNL